MVAKAECSLSQKFLLRRFDFKEWISSYRILHIRESGGQDPFLKRNNYIILFG